MRCTPLCLPLAFTIFLAAAGQAADAPAVLNVSNDDRVSPENSAILYLALKKAGVPAELHIYSTGGHGFGIRSSKNAVASWPKRCEEWLLAQKVLPGKTP